MCVETCHTITIPHRKTNNAHLPISMTYIYIYIHIHIHTQGNCWDWGVGVNGTYTEKYLLGDMYVHIYIYGMLSTLFIYLSTPLTPDPLHSISIIHLKHPHIITPTHLITPKHLITHTPTHIHPHTPLQVHGLLPAPLRPALRALQRRLRLIRLTGGKGVAVQHTHIRTPPFSAVHHGECVCVYMCLCVFMCPCIYVYMCLSIHVSIERRLTL